MRKIPTVTTYGEEGEADTPSFSPPRKAGIAFMALSVSIILFGLVSLYSTVSGTDGSSMLVKQALWAFIGITLATLINYFGYRRIIGLSPYFLFACAVMLLITAKFGPEIKGAHRWIRVPHVGNFQSSEFAKIALVMFLALYLPQWQRQISGSLKGLVIPGGVSLLILGLVVIGKDLGTTLLIATVVWLLFYVSGAKLRYLLPPVIGLPPLLYLYLKHHDPMRWARMTSYLNPEVVEKTEGYQLWLSLLALGSGHWKGLGFTCSRMKAEYLPEAHTDFILSIVGEELGFLALAGVIIAYIILLCLGIYISAKAREKEGMLLGFGITCLITLQAIVNIGVVSGAFPTKGMSAPLISYGGSNLVMCLIGAGLLLSVSTDAGDEHPDDFGSTIKTDPQKTDLAGIRRRSA